MPPDDVSVFRADSGEANGLDSDVDGLLLAAEHANRRVSRTLANGTIVAVANEYMGGCPPTARSAASFCMD